MNRVIKNLSFTLIAAMCLSIQLISAAGAATVTNPWAVEDALTFGEPESAVNRDNCIFKTVRIIGYQASTKNATICVYERPSWSYAEYGQKFLVSIGLDRDMYVVSNMSSRLPVENPYSNDLHFRKNVSGGYSGATMSVIKNFPSRLRQTVSSGGLKQYTLIDHSEQPFLTDQSGKSVIVGSVGFSDGGHWMVIQIHGKGFVLRNMETGQLQWFSAYDNEYIEAGTAPFSFVIAEDGSIVVIANSQTSHIAKVYSITADCGVIEDSYYVESAAELQQKGACPDDNGQIWLAVDRRFGGDWTDMKPSHLSYDNSVLYFRWAGNGIMPPQYAGYEYPLRSSAFEQAPNRLDYLALGDSYSSGEGDTVRLPWEPVYRKGTNEIGPPLENCHTSTRSYPYLLAAKYGLQSDKWNTVACSGAQVREDYYGDDNVYLGQNGRLDDISKPILPQYKNDARSMFTPGRVKQLEFIKKYQPKVITITGSGNDANFGSVLKACVPPLISFSDSDCWYAGSHGTTLLGIGIKSQYDNVRKLVREIKYASPGTTIYYVGYPQIIDGRQSCTHVSGLSLKERTLFRAGTTYLNGIIKAAAESEGAVYIDIEDVFESGPHHKTLCNPQPLDVNNFTLGCSGNAILKWLGKNLDCEESYHPNHFGHQAIARRIEAKYPTIMTDRPCAAAVLCVKQVGVEDVPVPGVFLEAYRDDAEANFTPIPMGGGVMVVQKGKSKGNIRMTIPYTQPNAGSRTYLTSEPTELGSIQSDADGVLTVDVPVPDSVAAGYHTLHVETHSSSGEPIELWQVVLVLGRDGDIDEDGIADKVDKCVLVPEQGRDLDKDGIDDGCDPYVSELAQTSGRDNERVDASRSELDQPMLFNRTIVAADDSLDRPLLSNESWHAPTRTFHFLDTADSKDINPDKQSASLTVGVAALSITATLMLLLKLHHAKKHPS